MAEPIKPVILDSEKCNGCVACMKRCPTEAIRVRKGKATIRYDRCVGCGECVKVCPTKAKKEYHDSFDSVQHYEYKICLPTPSVYGQFNHLTDVNYVLEGFLKLGFDRVYEVGVGAELVSAATKEYLNNPATVRPVISSACPAVTELILMRYSHLIGHLSPALIPEAVTAKRAVAEAMAETGLSRDKIGVFVVGECAAKVAHLKKSDYAPFIDGVLSLKEIYFNLLAEMNKLAGKPAMQISRVGRLGISWGSTAGEAVGLCTDNYLCCDGMENVIEVLNELEYDNLKALDFLELYMCPSGCVGGSMNVTNPFLARTRLRQIRNKTMDAQVDILNMQDYMNEKPYEAKEVFRLSENRADALKLACRMKALYQKLPGLDCGACGAPSCLALAEDLVKGEKGAKCRYRGKRDGKKQ